MIVAGWMDSSGGKACMCVSGYGECEGGDGRRDGDE